MITTEDLRDTVRAHLDGLASDADVALLQEHEEVWVATLQRLLHEADTALERVRVNVTGPERDLVLADFAAEREQIDAALAALTRRSQPEPEPEPEPEPPAPVALQLSWTHGRLVAWAAGRGSPVDGAEEVVERLRAAGAAADAWSSTDAVALPGDGGHADAVTASLQSTLGWLLTLGHADGDAAELAPSARWLGLVAELAVRLVAQGRMVPHLEQTDDGGGGRKGGRARFAVRWAPALIDADELGELVRALPGATSSLERSRNPRAFTEAVLADLVDTICRDAAARVEVPAPPPDPRSEQEVGEAVLARLDGEAFDAPHQRGRELGQHLQRWTRPVTGAAGVRLVVALDPPDDVGAWHLRTLAAVGSGKVAPVDAAMSNASNTRREAMKREMERLETLYPVLQRGKGRRRGQVVLGQDEAWQLMTSTGAVLEAAGFDVRVPPLSRRKPKPGLRLTSQAHESVAGASQLTSVRWSAVFDDVELSVEDITRLAAEARPLVQTRGRWVELDHADLEAAAAALAERADQTSLTGGEMLRHALGLEGTPLSGGISVAGDGWAADLLRSAETIPEDVPTRMDGFEGELRSYQGEALSWLRFLDGAGLGGCLALDMGLGKTPTVLAHLLDTTEDAPALVVVPPAVVGNWAAEARRFVPDLDVRVHHGPSRAAADELADAVGGADVLLTTYGTAVRDIDALEDLRWGTVVLDEAQVIKNPASETAQQLRRLDAHSRVVLTGTPVENGLGDLWALLDFTNRGLVGDRASFVSQLSRTGESRSSVEQALRALNGVLVFRRTKAEPAIAAELPDRIDVLDHCSMTPEQIGLYQAVLDNLVAASPDEDGRRGKGTVLAAITALKQICNHPAAYRGGEGGDLAGRSGKLARCEEIVDNAFAADERVLIFTHFARWGEQLAGHLSQRTGVDIRCYHGGLSRGARDTMVRDFQEGRGPGALVLSLKAGGTGLNLTAANHVVLYDRWWNPAVEDQARDRAWRIGQSKKVIAHRLVVPGTVDERVEEVVAGKRRIADLVLPAASSVDDLSSEQLRSALGLDRSALLVDEEEPMPEGAAI